MIEVRAEIPQIGQSFLKIKQNSKIRKLSRYILRYFTRTGFSNWQSKPMILFLIAHSRISRLILSICLIVEGDEICPAWVIVANVILLVLENDIGFHARIAAI
jgi:hypothetical protein